MTHLIRDCPKNINRQVQGVTVDEPKVLFIGNTEVTEFEDLWETMNRPTGRMRCDLPPGLAEVTEKNRLEALAEEDAEERLRETCEIQIVSGIVKGENKEKQTVSGIVKGKNKENLCETCEIQIVSGIVKGENKEKQTVSGIVQGENKAKEKGTDVKKPLLACKKLVEKGNVVQLGPELWQNYIMNVETGKKIMMEKRGGSFVIRRTS